MYLSKMSQLFMTLNHVYFMTVKVETTKNKIKYIKITSTLYNKLCDRHRFVYIKDRETGFVMFKSLLEFVELSREFKEKYFSESNGVYNYYIIPFKPSNEIDIKPYIEVDNIQSKLMTMFHHTWYNELLDFLKHQKFKDILLYIASDRKKKTVYPNKDIQYKAFLETPLNRVKVVFLGFDPYPQEYATGLAFASSTNYTPKSLSIIENAFKESIYRESEIYGVPENELQNIEKWKINNNLKHLTEQGVLLLNSSLTVIKSGDYDEAHSHYNIWTPFTYYVMKRLNLINRPLVFVMFGSKAQFYSKVIKGKQHYVFEIEHPASAARNNTEWYYKDVFNEVNKILISNNLKPILWI